ncbi:MAG: MFS transporter [Pseudomonadota bacterium]
MDVSTQRRPDPNSDRKGTPPTTRRQDEPSRNRYAVGISAYFGALFLIYGIHLPYFPVWLDWRGMDAAEIAIITALPFFVRFLASPVIALIADSRDAHCTTTIVLSWLALGAALTLTQLSSFWPIAAAALVLSLCKTSVMPMIETLAVSGVTRFRLDYGRMRLWGSLTFIFASLAGGALIESYGSDITIWLIVGACGITALAAHSLINPKAMAGAPDYKGPRVTSKETPATTATPSSVTAALGLLKKPEFVALLVATGAVQATHATYYIFGTLHWLSQGIDPIEAGLLWGIGVTAEIIVFAWAAPIIHRIGAEKLLLAGCAAAVLRWSLIATDPGF